MGLLLKQKGDQWNSKYKVPGQHQVEQKTFPPESGKIKYLKSA